MGYEKRKEMGQKPDPKSVKAKGEEKKTSPAKKMASKKAMMTKKKM